MVASSVLLSVVSLVVVVVVVVLARMQLFELNLGASFGTTERDVPLDFRPRGKRIRPSLSGVGDRVTVMPQSKHNGREIPYHGETNTGSGGLSKARRKEQQVRIVACNVRSCCHLFWVIFRYKNG